LTARLKSHFRVAILAIEMIRKKAPADKMAFASFPEPAT